MTSLDYYIERRYLVIDTPTHYVHVLRPGIIKIMFAPISHSLHKCEILNLHTYTWQISWWHTWESWLIDLIACFIFFVVKGKPPTTQKTLNDLNSFFKEEVWLLTFHSISFACFSGWDVFMMSVLLRSDFPPKILSCTKKRLGVVIAWKAKHYFFTDAHCCHSSFWSVRI